MEILVLSLFDPLDAKSGAGLRSASMVQALKRYGKVTVITFSENNYGRSKVDQVVYHRLERPTYTAMQRIKDLIVNRSTLLSRTFSTEYQDAVDVLLKTRPDLVVCESVFMTQYILNKPLKRFWVNEHNIEWQVLESFISVTSWIQFYKKLYYWAESVKLRSYELEALSMADTVLCVTDREVDQLCQLGLHGVIALPNVVALQEVNPDYLGNSGDVLFVGTLDYEPNNFGIVYFIKHIWPEIIRVQSSARLTIAGKGASAELQSLAHSNGIKLLGWVDDLSSVYAASSIVIAPIYSGGGTQFKVLQALSFGLPVVTTEFSGKAVVGLEHDVNCFMATTDSHFATLVLDLYNNAILRERLGKAGQDLIRSHYSQDSVDKIVEGVLVV